MLTTSPSTRPIRSVAGTDPLQRIRGYPAVSLIGDGSGPLAAVQARFRALGRDAVRRLEAEFGPDHPTVVAVAAEVEEQIRAVPGGHPTLTIFVSPSMSTWRPLPTAAVERVVIDDTFATRDLVHARLRSVPTWVVHLGAELTLHAGLGRTFRTVLRTEVPEYGVGDGGGDGKARARHRRDLVEPSRRRDQHLTHYVRAVDDALEHFLAGDSTPLVVIGSSRRTDAFTRTSRHRQRPVDGVTWTGRTITVDQVRGLAEPILSRIGDAQTRLALREVERAIGAGRLTTGLHNCWHDATAGRGDLLVVEESYAEPARLDPVTGVLDTTADREAPGVVDDIVDELIELVLAKGGRVSVVPDGTLEVGSRVALCTRA